MKKTSSEMHTKQYWLVKSEPDCYSIDDLKRDKKMHWDGVRNFQARNYMRDGMLVGDEVLFYHSSTGEPAVVGVASVCKAGYPDHTAWDTQSAHPDPRSTPEKPLWFMVDICFTKKFNSPLRSSKSRVIHLLKRCRWYSQEADCLFNQLVLSILSELYFWGREEGRLSVF